jgi:hypothetical protein
MKSADLWSGGNAVRFRAAFVRPLNPRLCSTGSRSRGPTPRFGTWTANSPMRAGTASAAMRLQARPLALTVQTVGDKVVWVRIYVEPPGKK